MNPYEKVKLTEEAQVFYKKKMGGLSSDGNIEGTLLNLGRALSAGVSIEDGFPFLVTAYRIKAKQQEDPSQLIPNPVSNDVFAMEKISNGLCAAVGERYRGSIKAAQEIIYNNTSPSLAYQTFEQNLQTRIKS